MPRILALESSTPRLSVALLADGQLSCRDGAPGAAHSDLILGLIHALLDESGLNLRQLDALAFGAGPGGFTGVRLACAVVQGLAYVAGLPVVAVCSLKALAWASRAQRAYVAVDARMGEVYYAAYRREDGVLRQVVAPAVSPPQGVGLPQGDGWRGLGSGFGVHGPILQDRLGGALAAIEADVFPHASAVAGLGLHGWRRGEAVDAALAQPLYVRDKVALTVDERVAAGGKA
ncbi:MAG: tRNA (adenosine(37)-N6)-threonylcarbamoyltransferase complex dimerization subunit type 1 TsaB [Betaproteobacteria bacterium]|nr:tRNA (adenosine(37)-N6)-threonylcarbamoyltransferase complex dimerization subunit type 1 TsaB [Betaproteobacteria bacterium]